VCIDYYREFVRSGRYRVRSETESSCFSALADREVKSGEEVSTSDIIPRPSLRRVYTSPAELLTGGWPTPMLKISEGPREAYAKLDFFNPFSNSIKDRTAYYLLKSVGGSKVVEVSSGNFALALGALGNIMGRGVKVYLPASSDYIAPFLEYLGVEYHIVDVTSTIEALELLEKDLREGMVHPNQFENDMNFIAHLRTAAEIDWQLSEIGRRPGYIIAAVGTSGHASALGFYFGTKYGARLIAVQPRDWIPGMRRVETGMKWIGMAGPEIVEVSLEEALDGVRSFARRFGLLIGPSAGAVYAAFLRRAESGVYVLIFPDGLFKYALLLKRMPHAARPRASGQQQS
jgi:cysteine synthase A